MIGRPLETFLRTLRNGRAIIITATTGTTISGTKMGPLGHRDQISTHRAHAPAMQKLAITHAIASSWRNALAVGAEPNGSSGNSVAARHTSPSVGPPFDVTGPIMERAGNSAAMARSRMVMQTTAARAGSATNTPPPVNPMGSPKVCRKWTHKTAAILSAAAANGAARSASHLSNSETVSNGVSGGVTLCFMSGIVGSEEDVNGSNGFWLESRILISPKMLS